LSKEEISFMRQKFFAGKGTQWGGGAGSREKRKVEQREWQRNGVFFQGGRNGNRNGNDRKNRENGGALVLGGKKWGGGTQEDFTPRGREFFCFRDGFAVKNPPEIKGL